MQGELSAYTKHCIEQMRKRQDAAPRLENHRPRKKGKPARSVWTISGGGFSPR